MIDYKEFRAKCSAFLQSIGTYKPESVLAIEMIVGHESKGGTYWRQIGGPALGIIQMEPDTHNDVWLHCDNILKYSARADIERDLNKLLYDINYNIFMARMRLIMDKNPLPDNQESMAHYLKSYWNAGGKATAAKYLNDWQEWKNAT